jgi:hypothetical protein
MSNPQKFIAFVVVVCLSPALTAYEPPVHRAITGRAFAAAQADLTRHLGLERDQKIVGFVPSRWAEQGAEDEDRIVPDFRSLHHFFDPAQMQGLSVSCVPVGTRADLWATDALPLGNTYAVRDAKLHYEAAVIGAGASTRSAAARDLFITLGHVVHLVQDMAQPEHTRNDQHLPGSNQMFQNGTQASVWESWGGVNLVNANAAPVSFDGYPVVRLPDYRSFFHTSDMDDGRGAGKGMADYSSLNFVTQDTNYHDEDPTWHCPLTLPVSSKCFFHTEPRIEEAAPRTVTSHYAVKIGDATEVVEVEEEIFTSFPRDHYLGTTQADPFHTHLSSLDLETMQFACDRLYSLSDGSYLSRASLLVPRAVGYSAGVIDHFFRGNIEASWKKMPEGGYELTVTNLSQEPIGADAGIRVVYRTTPVIPLPTGLDLDTAPVVHGELKELVPGFSGLAPGASVTIPNVTPLTLNVGEDITSFERRIVVTGTLGTEPDAVIGLVQPEPSKLVADMTVHCNTQRYVFVVWDVEKRVASWDQVLKGEVLRLLVPSATTKICTDPTRPKHVPDACIQLTSAEAGRPSARLTMAYDPAKRYVIEAIGESFPKLDWLPSCYAEIKISFDGRIVLSSTSSLGGSGANGGGLTIVFPR